MAYGVIMFYHLHMPLYILGAFTEYPLIIPDITILRLSIVLKIYSRNHHSVWPEHH